MSQLHLSRACPNFTTASIKWPKYAFLLAFFSYLPSMSNEQEEEEKAIKPLKEARALVFIIFFFSLSFLSVMYTRVKQMTQEQSWETSIGVFKCHWNSVCVQIYFFEQNVILTKKNFTEKLCLILFKFILK